MKNDINFTLFPALWPKIFTWWLWIMALKGLYTRSIRGITTYRELLNLHKIYSQKIKSSMSIVKYAKTAWWCYLISQVWPFKLWPWQWTLKNKMETVTHHNCYKIFSNTIRRGILIDREYMMVITTRIIVVCVQDLYTWEGQPK